MLLITSFVLFFIKYSTSDCVLDTGVSDRHLEAKLHEDFFKNDYKPYKQPDGNATIVAVKFILKDFGFDDKEELFTIYTWTIFQWKDPRLQWNVSDYEGIDKTVINGYNIWNPIRALTYLNEAGGYSHSEFYTYCQIEYTGLVSCTRRQLYQTVCISELNDWPYDYQICKFYLGRNKQSRDNLTFTFNETNGLSTFVAEYGAGWDIMGRKATENATGDITFNLTFVVERHATALGAMITFPTLIAATMTLSSLFLDAREALRLFYLTFCLYAHFEVLQAVSEHIPHHGPSSPSVLYFIRSSTLLTISCIVLTVILNTITKRTWKCYNWIYSINNFLLKSRARFLILPKWDATTTEDSTNVEAWTDFATIVNSVYILVIVVIYLSVYYMYMPQPIPIDREYNI